MSDEAVAGTESLLFGGRLMLRQPARGHRAGTDAVLAAAAAGACAGDEVVDAGCGVGTIGLAIALAEPAATVRLIESEPIVAALARENIALNDLADRVGVEEADLLAPRRHPATATLVVSNPPFYRESTTRPLAEPLKREAHVLRAADHGDWLRALIRLLAPHGRVVMIHRPEALPSLIGAGEGRIGGMRVQPVLARAGGDAIRILFGGIVGSRAPLTLAAPLILHGDDGAFTPAAAALHEGRARMPLLDVTRKSRPRRPAFSKYPVT